MSARDASRKGRIPRRNSPGARINLQKIVQDQAAVALKTNDDFRRCRSEVSYDANSFTRDARRRASWNWMGGGEGSVRRTHIRIAGRRAGRPNEHPLRPRLQAGVGGTRSEPQLKPNCNLRIRLQWCAPMPVRKSRWLDRLSRDWVCALAIALPRRVAQTGVVNSRFPCKRRSRLIGTTLDEHVSIMSMTEWRQRAPAVAAWGFATALARFGRTAVQCEL